MSAYGVVRLNRFLSSLLYALLAAGLAAAADKEIYNNGELVVWGREGGQSGVSEAPVPTYYNSVWQGDFRILEYSDKVPGQASWPLTMSDLIANTYVRPTCQMADGASGSLGTSVIGTISYRTAAGLQLIPQPTRADVTIGGSERLRTVFSGQFGADAQVNSSHSFPDPPIGSTVTTITTHFQAERNITLDAGLLGNDALRLVGFSSMFASQQQYDASAIRWIDPRGEVHFVRLSDSSPRDAHLFSSPMPIAVGGYFELIKETGSTWYPTSPSMRVDLAGLCGVGGRVGIQGWLASTTNPNHDSLSVWLEWMDAPATIATGAVYEATFHVTVTPPSRIWSGASSVDANWTTTSNWRGDSLPATGASLEFGPVSGPGNQFTSSNDLPAGTRFNGITFLSDAAAYTVTGHAIQLGGPLLNQSGNDQQINLPIHLLSGVGAIDTGAANVTLGETVSGVGPLVKSGSGTLILGSDSAYTGDTRILAGVLQMQGLENVGSTIVGDGTATADLVANHIRQTSLTIEEHGKVTITGGTGAGSTSVVNFLNIADGSGSFYWSGGIDGRIAAVPEPATWLLLAVAVLAGLAVMGRRILYGAESLASGRGRQRSCRRTDARCVGCDGETPGGRMNTPS